MIPALTRIIKRIREIPSRGLPYLGSSRCGDATDGIVWLTNWRSPNFVHGVRYEPCDPHVCESLLRSLSRTCGIVYENWTFIDVGCGKGRALKIAGSFPFKKRIGLDYSDKLTRIAKRLVDESVEIVCQDATEYEFPSDSLVVFMHHPFDKVVFDEVLKRLSGNVILVYLGIGRNWAGENPNFSEIARTEDAVIYHKE